MCPPRKPSVYALRFGFDPSRDLDVRVLQPAPSKVDLPASTWWSSTRPPGVDHDRASRWSSTRPPGVDHYQPLVIDLVELHPTASTITSLYGLTWWSSTRPPGVDHYQPLGIDLVVFPNSGRRPLPASSDWSGGVPLANDMPTDYRRGWMQVGGREVAAWSEGELVGGREGQRGVRRCRSEGGRGSMHAWKGRTDAGQGE